MTYLDQIRLRYTAGEMEKALCGCGGVFICPLLDDREPSTTMKK